MMFKEKKITLLAAGAFALAYIIAFWLNYIALYTGFGSRMLSPAAYFIEILSILLPPISVMLMLMAYSQKGIGSSFLRALIYSAVSLLLYFPASAFKFAYEGYDIFDVLLLALIEALISTVSLFALYALLFLIMLFVMKQFARHKHGADFNVQSAIKESLAFDFSSVLSLGMLSVTGIIFIYGLALEITDTVNFLISYSENYTATELFSIVFRYIFLLGMFIASQLLTFAVKNFLIKDRCAS